MLNVSAIEQAMRFKGLNAAALAALCDVSREAVSNWLSGESLPRPKHLLKLAVVLGLDAQQLYLDPRPEPVALLGERRKRIAASASAAARDAALEAAWHVGHLREWADRSAGRTRWFKRMQLREPSVGADYLRGLAVHLNEQAGLAPGQPLELRDWVRFLDKADVSLSPVGDRMSQRGGAYGAALVRDPHTDDCVALLALDVPVSHASHWLAWCWASAVSQPVLDAAQAGEFAHAVANALAPLPASAGTHTVSHLLGFEAGDALDVISLCEQLLHTPTFRGLDAMQRADGGRNHAWMARALQVGLADGYELTGALWFRERWPAVREKVSKDMGAATALADKAAV